MPQNPYASSGNGPRGGHIPGTVPTIEDLLFDTVRTIERKQSDGTRIRQQQPVKRVRPVKTLSSGNRFLHALLDGLVISAVQVGIAFIIISVNRHMTFDWSGFLIFLAYYFGLEVWTGRTLGKYATGGVAINKFGLPLSMNEAFVRTICRIIPFEAFSFLGSDRGWHDKFSETYVVHKDEMAELQRLMQIQFPNHPEYVKRQMEGKL